MPNLNIITRLTDKGLILITSLFTLIACNQQTVAINPEHIPINELNEQLQQALSHTEKMPINPLSITIDQLDGGGEALILSGDKTLVAKAISIAKQLDKTQNYYLEIRDTPIEAISSSLETMRILLHPEQTISIGHIALINSPWGGLMNEGEKLLRLKLDSSLILSIEIKNTDNMEINFYSGKHPMQLDLWVTTFNNSEINQGRKIITSRPKKQLWLRLVKASSQSKINLR